MSKPLDKNDEITAALLDRWRMAQFHLRPMEEDRTEYQQRMRNLDQNIVQGRNWLTRIQAALSGHVGRSVSTRELNELAGVSGWWGIHPPETGDDDALATVALAGGAETRNDGGEG